jgi:hypothetical protein
MATTAAIFENLLGLRSINKLGNVRYRNIVTVVHAPVFAVIWLGTNLTTKRVECIKSVAMEMQKELFSWF